MHPATSSLITSQTLLRFSLLSLLSSNCFLTFNFSFCYYLDFKELLLTFNFFFLPRCIFKVKVFSVFSSLSLSVSPEICNLPFSFFPPWLPSIGSSAGRSYQKPEKSSEYIYSMSMSLIWQGNGKDFCVKYPPIQSCSASTSPPLLSSLDPLYRRYGLLNHDSFCCAI